MKMGNGLFLGGIEGAGPLASSGMSFKEMVEGSITNVVFEQLRRGTEGPCLGGLDLELALAITNTGCVCEALFYEI